MNDPRWLTTARGYIGQAEVPGPRSSSWIERMWAALPGGRWFWEHYGSDDSLLPWCGAFVARCLQESEIELPKRFASARGWLDWGTPLVSPAVGCVAVLERDGGGHVGFVVGQDEHGNILLLGGNQGNAVSIAAFPRSRVIGYRWPAAEPLPVGLLPQMAGAPASTGEA